MTPETLTQEYFTYKQSHASSSRAANTRASEIGHPCTAYLALTRVAGEQAMRPDPVLSCIFAEGRNQERAVSADLLEMGYQVYEAQRTVYWDKFEVSGHIDGKIVKNGNQPVMIEIKSCSPFAFAKINCEQDIRDHKSHIYRKWAAQLQIYMLLEGEEVAWLIMKNKATGEIKVIEFKLDMAFAEQFIQRAETVKAGVALYHDYEGAPDWRESWLKDHRLNDPDICLACPLKHVCLPEIDAGPGAFISSDPDMPDKIKRHQELKHLGAEYDELHEEITSRAKRVFEGGNTTIICGDWLIVGKKQERNGKPFWTTKISFIEGREKYVQSI